jgi:hypothetical protein
MEKDEGKKTSQGRASSKQRMLLERIFLSNPYPNLQLRTQLGEQLGMTPRKVQIWFQNRRTKQKSIQDEPAHQIQVLAQAVDEETISIFFHSFSMRS